MVRATLGGVPLASTQIEVADGDWDIIMYLKNLLQNLEMDPPFVREGETFRPKTFRPKNATLRFAITRRASVYG
jgi:hypothetical protein